MADQYVTKSGNDSTGNGTEGNPYLTVTKGLSLVGDGDTVFVGIGTYSESLTLTNGTHGGKDITIEGAIRADTIITQVGVTVIVQDSVTNHMTLRFKDIQVYAESHTMLVTGLCSIVLDNVKITSAGSDFQYGIFFNEHSTPANTSVKDLTVINGCTVLSEDFAFNTRGCGNILIEDSTFDDIDGTRSRGGIFQYEQFGCGNVVIQNNSVIGDRGFCLDDGGNANQTTMGSVSVLNNTINEEGAGVIRLFGKANGVVVRGNRLIRDGSSGGGSGIELGRETVSNEKYGSPTNDINELPFIGAVIVEDNHIIFADGATQSHGIIIALGTNGASVVNNFVRSADEGIVIKQATAQLNYGTISNNRLYGSGITISGTEGWVANNNSIHLTTANKAGLLLNDNQRLEDVGDNNQWHHNIVVQDGGQFCFSFEADKTDDFDTYTDYNCYHQGSATHITQMQGSGNTSLANTITDWEGTNWEGSTAATHPQNESHTILENPRFTDPTNGDFTINNVNIPSNMGADSGVEVIAGGSRYDSGGRY